MISETPNTTIQAVASISVVVIFMVLLVTIIILIVVGLLLLNRRSKTQGHHHNSFRIYPNLLYYNNPKRNYNAICLWHYCRLSLSFSGDIVQSTSYRVDSSGDYDEVQDELCIEQSCDKHTTDSAAIDLKKSSSYYSTLTQKQPQEEQTSTSNVCIMYK